MECMTTEEAKAYVECWQRAAPELAARRREELRDLSDEQFRALALEVLEFGDNFPQDRRTSGLVEQQRIFQKAGQ